MARLLWAWLATGLLLSILMLGAMGIGLILERAYERVDIVCQEGC